jgi:hypothetical protein
MMNSEDAYKDAESIIEDLVKIKSYKYRRCYYGADDIAQEIRIKCWQILDTFDEKKGKSLKSYLNVCTENFLRNLIRDRFATFNPPCKKTCDHYRKDGSPNENAVLCETFMRYLKLYRAKASVRMPTSVDNIFDNTAEGLISNKCTLSRIDLDLSIRDYLRIHAEYLLPFYDKIVGSERIPEDILEELQCFVREMLDE